MLPNARGERPRPATSGRQRFLLVALFVAAAAFAVAAKPAPKPKPPPLTPEQRAAQALLKPLSLRDRVAQLVIGVVYADAMSSDFNRV